MPLENVQNPHGYGIFGTSRTKAKNPHGYGILQNLQKDETKGKLSLSGHARSRDYTADLPTALSAQKHSQEHDSGNPADYVSRLLHDQTQAGSDGGKDRHKKWACAMCLAFDVRQDGRSLALDSLDPARKAGNESERRHDRCLFSLSPPGGLCGRADFKDRQDAGTCYYFRELRIARIPY